MDILSIVPFQGRVDPFQVPCPLTGCPCPPLGPCPLAACPLRGGPPGPDQGADPEPEEPVHGTEPKYNNKSRKFEKLFGRN